MGADSVRAPGFNRAYRSIDRTRSCVCRVDRFGNFSVIVLVDHTRGDNTTLLYRGRNFEFHPLSEELATCDNPWFVVPRSWLEERKTAAR